MSEFDEMLRAGVISPGSQPHVESTKGTPSGEGLPTATVTVTSEARDGTLVAVDETSRRLERARVLILSTTFEVGRRAQAALASECHSLVSCDKKPLSQGLTFDLVVFVANFIGVERVVAQNIPVVLLCWPEARAAAAALVQGRRIAVVTIPDLEERLLEQVQSFVGAWLPHAT